MIVLIKKGTNQAQIKKIGQKIAAQGLKTTVIRGTERTVVLLIGNTRKIEVEQLKSIPGVEKIISVLKPYKLVTRDFKPKDTVIRLGNNVAVGGKKLAIIAGPCSVESEDQVLRTAQALKKIGVKILRGGAFKPRSSPYSFQGLGEKGLKILAKARQKTGLKIITEVMAIDQINLVAQYADILQVGARNAQNFSLLKALAKIKKPVLLKRGISSTLDEFLLSAEYLLSGGNKEVILCERGIRTFNQYTRFTLDLSIVPAIKKLSHLPIIVDPSHGTGRRDLIIPMSKAAIVAGADGLMIEVHPQPSKALSDGDQSLNFKEFQQLIKEIKSMIKAEKKIF